MYRQAHSEIIRSEADGSELFRVDLEGRFMVKSREEFPCRIVEISTREILFSSAVKPDLDEKIIVYLAELGRFEGVVDRHEATGFGVKMNLSQTKHNRLAEQLAQFANRGSQERVDSRRHKRMAPMRQLTMVRLSDGTERFGKIKDISTVGVAIEINVDLSIGTRVLVDSRAATVKRLFEGGFFAEFGEDDVLICKGYGASFGAKVILAEVNLTVLPRGITVLVGPAGTGKSTLLRSLAGFFSKNGLFRSWGEALYKGAPLSAENAPGFVMQRIEMTQRSVLDSLVFHLRQPGQSSDGHRDKIASWLGEIGAPQIVEHFDRSFIDLEPALQRTVAILREAAANPSLLMIDEPTSGLSDEDASSVLQLIEALAQKMAVLVVLHNQKQIQRIARSVILLAGGRVQEQSETTAFFNHSQNEAVRQFVQSGSCALPAPDSQPDSLAEDVAPPPPLPVAAVDAIRLASEEQAEKETSAPVARPAEHWLDALAIKPATNANGPQGFMWIIEGRLAGVSRPGAVNDMGYDLDLLKSVGVTTLITLTETNFPPGVLFLHGLENVHLAIPDGKAPTLEKAEFLLRRIRHLLEAGKVLAVHCLQGVGRTGTILAACLIDGKGLTAEEAITRLRALNPEFVKTEEQLAFLAAYEKAVKSRI